MTPNRKILSPYNPREAISVKQAAARSGKSVGTIRLWCTRFGIGRKVGCEMHVSRVALEMFLENDRIALDIYHAGVRNTESVQRYFDLLAIENQIAQIAQTRA